MEEIAAPMLEVLLNPEGLETVHDSMYIDLIANCHDVNQFKTWATRVLTVKTLKDIFPEFE